MVLAESLRRAFPLSLFQRHNDQSALPIQLNPAAFNASVAAMEASHLGSDFHRGPPTRNVPRETAIIDFGEISDEQKILSRPQTADKIFPFFKHVTGRSIPPVLREYMASLDDLASWHQVVVPTVDLGGYTRQEFVALPWNLRQIGGDVFPGLPAAIGIVQVDSARFHYSLLRAHTVRFSLYDKKSNRPIALEYDLLSTRHLKRMLVPLTEDESRFASTEQNKVVTVRVGPSRFGSGTLITDTMMAPLRKLNEGNDFIAEITLQENLPPQNGHNGYHQENGTSVFNAISTNALRMKTYYEYPVGPARYTSGYTGIEVKFSPEMSGGVRGGGWWTIQAPFNLE